jgi:hypothetical protein
LRVTGPARSTTVAIRPRSPTRHGAILICMRVSSGQVAGLANRTVSALISRATAIWLL